MANGAAHPAVNETHLESPTSSRLLSSSISSISSSTRQGSSLISKTYKQASTLFLTRRLQEAYLTLIPILTSDASKEGDDHVYDANNLAPVASAPRSYRIKVWSLYLTLLDAIVNLGPEDGKAAFGSREWREMAAKVRDGGVWKEVVRDGYQGAEGMVDAEVVINLATLLLSHAPSQTLNQERLENHLSALATPTLDVSGHVEANGGSHHSQEDQRRSSPPNGGTNTPRDLTARIKILELYTLHVLPRNEEWDYAKEFIGISEVLDEENREAFLHTLESLREERNGSARAEAETRRQQEEQLLREKQEALAQAAKIHAAKANVSSARESTSLHQRAGSETDYGIEAHPSAPTSSKATTNPRRSKASRLPQTGPGSSPTSSGAAKKSPNPYHQITAILAAFQQSALSMARSLSANPMTILRTILFVISVLVACSRQEIRERIRRITGTGWNRLKGTIGMGVKVSYI
ncbi:MAG: hypothetical protein M1838_004236 [Thelocarpon superellum]|nr:MAG: hypothetical protein M1838_004236 [Thelocarpon superellum]